MPRKKKVNINTSPNLTIHISEGRMQEDATEVCEYFYQITLGGGRGAGLGEREDLLRYSSQEAEGKSDLTWRTHDLLLTIHFGSCLIQQISA